MFGLFNVRYKLEDPFAKRIMEKATTKTTTTGSNDIEVGKEVGDSTTTTTTDEFTDAKRWELDSTHFGYSSRDQINVHGEFGEIARAISTDLKHPLNSVNACGGGPVHEIWRTPGLSDGNSKPSTSELDKVSVRMFGSYKQ